MTTRKKLTIWEFVNSSFGLWLLSTVALGFISFGYSQFSNHLKMQNNTKMRIIKLDQEIEGRIYQLLSKQERETDSIRVFGNSNLFSSANQGTFKELWFEFKTSPNNSYDRFYSMYPEFNERNTISLIVELSSLLDSPNQKSQLEKVAWQLTANEGIPIEIANNEQLKKTLKYISTNLRIDRWKKYWPQENDNSL